MKDKVVRQKGAGGSLDGLDQRWVEWSELVEGSPVELAALSMELLAEIEPDLVAQGHDAQNSLGRAHFVALRNWLGKYRTSEEMSGRETVRGFEEAYYHLREMGAWRLAVGVKKVSLRVRKGVAHQMWKRSVNDEVEQQKR